MHFLTYRSRSYGKGGDDSQPVKQGDADMRRSNLAFLGNPARVYRLLLTVVLATVAVLWPRPLWLGGPRKAEAAPPFHPSNPEFDLTFIVVADPQFRGPSNDDQALEGAWAVYVTNAMNSIDLYDWPSTSQSGWMLQRWGSHQLQGGGDPIAKPEFAVVAGDMTMGARQDQLDRFKVVLECDSMGLNCPLIEYPVYAGLGNHDLPADRMWDYIYSRYAGAGPVDHFYFDADSYAYSWTPDGYEMYLLQLHRFAGDAEYKPSGLPFLEDHLAAGPDKLVLLFQHYGWDPGSTEWWSASDRTNLASAIDGHNVIGIFHGHTHDYYSDETDYVESVNVYTTIAGAPVIHVPAMIDWAEETDPATPEEWTIAMGWFAVVRVTDTYMDIAWVQVAGGTPVNFHTWRSVPLNQVPSVDAGANATIDEGSAFTRSGSFDDLDADEWTATVDYGDGSGTQELALYPLQMFDLDHTYADDGIYTAVVTVTDHHGTAGTDDVTVTVNNLPPTVTSFSKSGSEDADIPLTAAEFVDNFDDVPADPLDWVRITSLSDRGTLTLGGSPVTVGQEIAVASLDTLVFTPDADWNGATSLGWNGYDGQAYAAANAAVNIMVSSVNDAPVLTPLSPAMTSISEDDIINFGMTVADIVGTSIGDVDSGALEGIAIYALDSGNGTWEYKTGSSWYAVGAVSTSSALLLRSGDSARFVPDGENGTSASFSYYAWDQTSGLAGAKVNATTRGGTTALSSTSDAASITVSSVNDAPVLDDSGDLRLDTINEDDTSSPGTVVSAIVISAGGDRITDVDVGALEGIAVIGADSAHGAWQYSTDGGSNWHNLGSPSPGAARLLASSAVTRFVPDADYNGTVDPGITFRAWDRSSGANGGIADTTSSGGTTPFSTATETASIVVRIAADLSVGKLAEPTTIVPGQDAITYTVVVHNAGPSTIVDATLTDALPAALVNPTWTCVASGAACPSPAGSGNLDETLVLPDGSVLTYTITGLVDSSATSLANTAHVDNPAFEIDAGNNSATIVPTLERQADVSIAKSQMWTGSSITYTVVVRNFGPSDAPGTAVSDPAPVELGGVLWTCATAGGATCGGGGSGDIDEVVDLPAGSVITYTITGAILQVPVVNEATVTPPVAVNDLVSSNNRAMVQHLRIYLPLLARNYARAPNLVVESLAATPDAVTVTIRNQGDAPVVDEFCVIVYIDPIPAPTHVNQIWAMLGSEGLVWGITAPLQPGGAMTLTVESPEYWASLSYVSWPLPVGARVYAQVDSVGASYGGVLEGHEITGGVYDNIRGPVIVQPAG